MTLPLAAASTAVATSQGGSLNSVISAGVTLAIVVLLAVSRVYGRRLEPARLLAGPLVLIAIGIGSAAAGLQAGPHATQHVAWDGIDYLIGSIDLLDSLIVGTIRGFTVRIYQRDGADWYRYGAATVALWLVSIVIRVALAIVGAAHHASPLIVGSDLLFMLGLALLSQNGVVAWRHARQRAPIPAMGEGRGSELG
jgi:hypothetical protein